MKNFVIGLLTVLFILVVGGIAHAMPYGYTVDTYDDFDTSRIDAESIRWEYSMPAHVSVPYDELVKSTRSIWHTSVDSGSDKVDIEGILLKNLTSLQREDTRVPTTFSFVKISRLDDVGNNLYNIPSSIDIRKSQKRVEITTSSISITLKDEAIPAPEPAPLLVLGIGLLGLVRFGQKKDAKK